MRIISQDKKYDLPYENYGFMIDGSDIRAIGIPDVIASYPCRKAAELAMEDIRITRFSNVCCLQFQKSNHFCKEGECDIYRECQKSKSPKYDVILLERPGSEGLSNEDVIRLTQFMDADKTYYPVEFYKANVDSAAMGFVATNFLNTLLAICTPSFPKSIPCSSLGITVSLLLTLFFLIKVVEFAIKLITLFSLSVKEL